MARFHAQTWAESDYDRTVSILSFNTKAARAAYCAQSAQRTQCIDAKRKNDLLKEGRMQRLMLWNASEPTKFVVAA